MMSQMQPAVGRTNVSSEEGVGKKKTHPLAYSIQYILLANL